MSDSPNPAKEKRPRDPERWIRLPMEQQRKAWRTLDYRPSLEFFDLADRVIPIKRTLLGYDRLYALWQASRNVVELPGRVAEIGSYRGGSAYFLASAFLQLTGQEVPMDVFDTFEGHPEQAISEHDGAHTKGKFASTSYDDVCAYLSAFHSLTVHRGDIASVLPSLPESAYRLVHVDTDLYRPTVVCLDYFAARMPSGGVVVIDDYGSRDCPGVSKAAREYLERNGAFQVWDPRTQQLVLVKR